MITARESLGSLWTPVVATSTLPPSAVVTAATPNWLPTDDTVARSNAARGRRRGDHIAGLDECFLRPEPLRGLNADHGDALAATFRDPPFEIAQHGGHLRVGGVGDPVAGLLWHYGMHHFHLSSDVGAQRRTTGNVKRFVSGRRGLALPGLSFRG